MNLSPRVRTRVGITKIQHRLTLFVLVGSFRPRKNAKKFNLHHIWMLFEQMNMMYIYQFNVLRSN